MIINFPFTHNNFVNDNKSYTTFNIKNSIIWDKKFNLKEDQHVLDRAYQVLFAGLDNRALDKFLEKIYLLPRVELSEIPSNLTNVLVSPEFYDKIGNPEEQYVVFNGTKVSMVNALNLGPNTDVVIAFDENQVSIEVVKFSLERSKSSALEDMTVVEAEVKMHLGHIFVANSCKG